MIPSTVEVRRHELLADLAEKAARFMIERGGMADDLASALGNDLADFIADNWRGQTIYFVGDAAFRNSDRDWEIWRRSKTGNAHELAKEFGISYVRVYQIVRRCTDEYRRSVQPSLFDDGQAAP